MYGSLPAYVGLCLCGPVLGALYFVFYGGGGGPDWMGDRLHTNLICVPATILIIWGLMAAGGALLAVLRRRPVT